jgi:hypothetical protein
MSLIIPPSFDSRDGASCIISLKIYSFHPFLKMMEYMIFLNKFKNSLIGLRAVEDFNGKKVPQS